MKLYACAVTASRMKEPSYIIETRVTLVMVLPALSLEEARGKALTEAEREQPRSDQWFNHAAVAVEIPLEKIREVYKL